MQPFHKNISIRASEDNEFILRNQENDYQSTPLLGTKSDDNFAKQSLEFSASQRLARKTDNSKSCASLLTSDVKCLDEITLCEEVSCLTESLLVLPKKDSVKTSISNNTKETELNVRNGEYVMNGSNKNHHSAPHWGVNNDENEYIRKGIKNDEKDGWILQIDKKKRSSSITEENETITEENEIENNIDLKNRYFHIFCMNCGKKGHLTKKCNYPIISLGIVTIHIDDISTPFNNLLNLCKKIQHHYLFEHDELEDLKRIYQSLKSNDIMNHLDDKIHYLMIRRRNSLSYVDFIRGKYDLDDYEYIYNTLLMMTKDEQEELQTRSFEELWSELWTTPIHSINHNQEYIESKQKFLKLREGYMIQKCEIQFPFKMKNILDTSLITYEEAEWGFPKGRRNIHEKNIECAKREFQEETGIDEKEYQILNISPLEEIYLGSNHIRYKHIYYFSQMTDMKEMKVDKKNVHQKSEVGDIRWVTFKEGFSLIRDYHKEKRNILFNTHQFIKNVISHFCILYQVFEKKNKDYSSWDL